MKLYTLPISKLKKINPKQITISVFGLGKMGLPLAATFAKHNFKVIGVDTNDKTVEHINSGKNPVQEEAGLTELIQKVVKKKQLTATTDGIKASKDSDIKVIIIPIYLDSKNNPDLSILKDVIGTIAKGLNKGDIVILESTAPAGTTINKIGKELEKLSGLKLNQDFAVAHCPERISSLTAIKDIEGRLCPKIVGGSDAKTTKICELIYNKINKRGTIAVQSPTVAELVKMWGEIYRDVNIAFANNLYLSCKELGVDAFEVIKASNTNPYSRILTPGPGVGGHCIPVYPYFILNTNKQATELLKLSRKINDSMSEHVTDLLEDALKEKEIPLKEASILVLGIAYRGGVKETRKSPGIKIASELKNKAKKVFVYDPHFNAEETKNLGLVYKKDFTDVDGIIIATEEKIFKKMNWNKIAKEMKTKLVVDTKNLINLEKLTKLNFVVRRLGYAK